MRKMGSKTEARKTVSAAGTPVVPGDNGPPSIVGRYRLA
jgi:acetyl/propionyl-CoA carboxylase alpha subunit